MSHDSDVEPVHPVPPPVIRIAPLGELNLYLVSDEELRLLEEGSPSSLFLNFALTFLSVGFSFFATLLSTDIGTDRVFTVFVVICVLSLIAGIVLLSLWWRSRGQVARLVKRIRDRMPPAPGIPQQ